MDTNAALALARVNNIAKDLTDMVDGWQANNNAAAHATIVPRDNNGDKLVLPDPFLLELAYADLLRGFALLRNAIVGMTSTQL